MLISLCDVQSLSENTISAGFVLTLLAQFVVIIWERVIYINRWIRVKLVWQYIEVRELLLLQCSVLTERVQTALYVALLTFVVPIATGIRFYWVAALVCCSSLKH